MLRILVGPDWTANRNYILGQVSNHVSACQKGILLMVPELISHDTERRLAAAAGDTSSLYAQVLTFSRLAQRVCEYTGRGLDQAMDAGGRVVAMASAARQLSGVLKAYASVETNPEFLSDLVEAVDEFKRCCITAQDLLRASKESTGSFAQKLQELSLLMETYDALCAQGKRDPRDQMNLLLELLEDSDFAANHTLYVDGFPDFTRQHFNILAHFISNSPLVTVCLCCDRPGSELLAYEKAGETANMLIRYAKQNGVSVEVVTIPGRREDLLHTVRSSLFQGPNPAQPQLRQAVSLGRCATPLDECAFTAQKIRQLTSQGARFRDIAIVCPDMEQYRNLLRMTFHRSGIPLYLSGTENILNKSVIYTVLCALDAAVEGFEQEDVLRYAKSVLSPLDRQICDKLENYVLTWNISRRQWEAPWKFHPKGLHREWEEEDSQALSQLNEARELLMEPLCRLRSSLQNSHCLADSIQGLYAFLEDIRLSVRLDDLARAMDEQGDNRSAQELDQLWEIIISALEQLYDTLGSTHWEMDTFTRLLRLLLSNYDVGTIPPVLDAVTVGSVSAMRGQACKHLFVLGCLEGSIPSYAGSAGILSDAERDALRRLGIPLTGGGLDGLKSEYSDIYSCVCGVQKSMTFLAPAGQESYLLRRLCTLLGLESIENVRPNPVLRDSWDVGAYLLRSKDWDNAQKLNASQGYREAADRCAYSLGKLQPETVRSLYGRELRLSASQIDLQAECRFSYFLRYGLKAQERKEATVDPAEFGTFVHTVLEYTAREVRDMGGFQKVSLPQTLEISQKHARAYAQEHFAVLDSQRMSYLLQRNGQELQEIVQDLWEEHQFSQFQPVDFEVCFGLGDGMDAIDIPGASMPARIRGKVDRVDLWEGKTPYFRVVDYKTGRKDFDYCDVFNGVGLQMLLYMFALEQSGSRVLGTRAKAAGVQYFPARAPLLSAEGKLTAEEAVKQRKKLRRRNGLLLGNEEVLNAMEQAEEFVLLPCKRKKDGTLTGDLASESQLKTLRQFLFRQLAGMVNEIASGEIAPDPYTRGAVHDACRFCPYRPICREASEENRRDYQAMTSQRFWEEVEKEVEKWEKSPHRTSSR